jgi:hypothetical protein
LTSSPGFRGGRLRCCRDSRGRFRGRFEADSFGLDDLNFFDGAACDAAEVAPGALFRAFLPAFFVTRVAFTAGFFADFAGWPRAALRAGVLGDFLRVFLDIRLPFVAFGGSTIGVLRGQDGIEPTAGQI